MTVTHEHVASALYETRPDLQRRARGTHGVWSMVGLFVTLFAFLAVNMFLSGLHAYGEL